MKAQKVPLLLNSAACRQKGGDFGGALKDCNKALEIQPSNLKALFRRANCYFETNALDLAQQDIRKVKGEGGGGRSNGGAAAGPQRRDEGGGGAVGPREEEAARAGREGSAAGGGRGWGGAHAAVCAHVLKVGS